MASTTKYSAQAAPKRTFKPEDFKIEPVKMENYEQYLAILLEFFIPREPLSVGVGCTSKLFEKRLRDMSQVWMSSGASVCATYLPTREVAGVMLTQILTRKEKEIFDTQKTEKDDDPRITTLVRILVHLEKSVDVFKDPSVDKVLEIAATCVNPKFAGCKLTYRLTEESERLAYNLGCQLVTSQSTNNITQHIRAKLGYELCYTLDYTDFKLDGKKVVDTSLMGGTTTAKVFKKYLKKKEE